MNFNPLNDSNGKKNCDCDLDWNESHWMSGKWISESDERWMSESDRKCWCIFFYFVVKSSIESFLLIEVAKDDQFKSYWLYSPMKQANFFIFALKFYIFFFQFYICESFRWKWLRLIHLMNVGSRNSVDFIYQYNVSLFNLA